MIYVRIEDRGDTFLGRYAVIAQTYGSGARVEFFKTYRTRYFANRAARRLMKRNRNAQEE